VPYELPIPEFLQEDEETIHRRMLEKAPPGISTKEGDFFWDATRPTAIEKAEVTQLKLQNILRLAFPQTSYGQYLDFLGEMKGVFRHPATPATGTVVFTGQPGTVIPAGFVVLTEATGSFPTIEFQAKERTQIGEDGTATVAVECLESGTIGNVAANTITLLSEPINGIASVTNPEPFTGGTEMEDDDSFRERVLAAYDEPLSGAKKDYERWAKEVPGVGAAYIIPLWDGPGTVKVLIMDSNGEPANQELIEAVQEHIAPDGNQGGGLAPIGADVMVDAPEVFEVNIALTIVLKDGYTLEDVMEDLTANIKQFLGTFEINTGDRPLDRITVTRLGYVVLETEGIADYSGLTVNNDDEYVEIPVGKAPMLGDVVVT
jgi:uncharacterized phage protein gp47/JayE